VTVPTPGSDRKSASVAELMSMRFAIGRRSVSGTASDGLTFVVGAAPTDGVTVKSEIKIIASMKRRVGDVMVILLHQAK
jgi:hypothetical protein